MEIYKTFNNIKTGDFIYSTWAKKEPKYEILDKYYNFSQEQGRNLILYIDDKVSEILKHGDKSKLDTIKNKFSEYTADKNGVKCVFSSDSVGDLVAEEVYNILSELKISDYKNLILSKNKTNSINEEKFISITNFLYNYKFIKQFYKNNTFLIGKSSMGIYYFMLEQMAINLIVFNNK